MQDCALQDVPARSSDCAAAVFAATPSCEVPFKGGAKLICFLKHAREVLLVCAIVVLFDVLLVSYPHPAKKHSDSEAFPSCAGRSSACPMMQESPREVGP